MVSQEITAGPIQPGPGVLITPVSVYIPGITE